ncbi:MAG: hypothetical protein QW687_02120, partial [Candidatus Hadarchaeales archaeon]
MGGILFTKPTLSTFVVGGTSLINSTPQPTFVVGTPTNQPISSTPVVGDTTHRLQQPTLVVGKIPPFSKEEKKKDPSEGTPSDPTSSWGNPSFKEGEEPPVGGNLPLTSKKEEKLPSWGEISSSFSKEERGDILHQLNHPPNLPVVGGHSSSTNPTPVVGTLFTNSNNPLVVGKSPLDR